MRTPPISHWLLALILVGFALAGCSKVEQKSTSAAADSANASQAPSATRSPANPPPTAGAAKPSASKPLASVNILLDAGDYRGLLGGRTSINSRAAGRRYAIVAPIFGIQNWRQTFDLVVADVRNQQRRAVFYIPFYSFLPASDRSIDLGEITEPRCFAPSTEEPVGETELVRRAQYWKGIREACRSDDDQGYNTLHALSKALYAEKKLALKWPEQYVVDTELLNDAEAMLDASRMCQKSARKPICETLGKEVRESQNLDFNIYNTIGSIPDADVAALSDGKYRDLLLALRAAQEAYETCRGGQGKACTGADFEELKARICSLGTGRAIPSKDSLCRPFTPKADKKEIKI